MNEDLKQVVKAMQTGYNGARTIEAVYTAGTIREAIDKLDAGDAEAAKTILEELLKEIVKES